MIQIDKKKEPASLVEHRSKTNSEYSNLPSETKNELRLQLLEEQGYICAYCMKRIKDNNNTTKIEHFNSQHPPKAPSDQQDKALEEQLKYSNLLVVCLGNQGQSFEEQTCDTHKGNMYLKYNPAENNFYNKAKIKYGTNPTITGEIRSEDGEFNQQLNEVLNLNHNDLKANRASIINGIKKTLNLSKRAQNASKIARIYKIWLSRDKKNQLQEYCGIALFYLRERLDQLRK